MLPVLVLRNLGARSNILSSLIASYTFTNTLRRDRCGYVLGKGYSRIGAPLNCRNGRFWLYRCILPYLALGVA